MANANLLAIIMVILVMNIFLYVGGIRVIGEDTNELLGNFIDTDEYVNGSLVIDSGFESTLPTSYQQSGSTDGIFSFIDTLQAVGDFAIFIVNIVFTPIGLFISAGLPVEVGLIVGLPMIMGMVLGIIYFIRSGN